MKRWICAMLIACMLCVGCAQAERNKIVDAIDTMELFTLKGEEMTIAEADDLLGGTEYSGFYEPDTGSLCGFYGIVKEGFGLMTYRIDPNSDKLWMWAADASYGPNILNMSPAQSVAYVIRLFGPEYECLYAELDSATLRWYTPSLEGSGSPENGLYGKAAFLDFCDEIDRIAPRS